MMESVHQLVAYIGPAWATFGGAAAVALIASTIANIFRDPDHDPSTPPPRWVMVVDVLALIAAKGHVGVLGRLSLPGVRSRKRKLPGTSGPLPPAAALVFVPLLLLSACGYCKLPDKVAEPRCVLERNLIACGEQAGYSILPTILSVVGQAIGGHFDSGSLVNQLEQQGFKNLPCLIASVQDYVLPVAPQMAGDLHESLKVALKRSGKSGPIDIRLKSGKVVKALVP